MARGVNKSLHCAERLYLALILQVDGIVSAHRANTAQEVPYEKGDQCRSAKHASGDSAPCFCPDLGRCLDGRPAATPTGAEHGHSIAACGKVAVVFALADVHWLQEAEVAIRPRREDGKRDLCAPANIAVLAEHGVGPWVRNGDTESVPVGDEAVDPGRDGDALRPPKPHLCALLGSIHEVRHPPEYPFWADCERVRRYAGGHVSLDRCCQSFTPGQATHT